LNSSTSGKVVDKTFNAGVKIEIAILEKREMNFLYKEGDDFVFMDNVNFDQMTISSGTVGEAANYMLENTEAIVAIHEGNPLYLELAASVPLKITYTEPGLQGDRSSGGTKPATVETGIQIQVPLFIKQDEIVLVDTRDGSYLGRAN
jgi:elongation factor P